MKKLILFSCICTIVSFSAFSQVVYLADTAFTTDAGYDGAPASCVFTGGTATGWEMNRLIGTWLADVFTVPADTTWIFDTVIVYGIQEYNGTTSTFLSVNLQIYDTVPSLGCLQYGGILLRMF